MLEELGVPYTLRMLPFPPRALAREFLADNPLGTVPLLVDGDTRMARLVVCQRGRSSWFSVKAAKAVPHGCFLAQLTR